MEEYLSYRCPQLPKEINGDLRSRDYHIHVRDGPFDFCAFDCLSSTAQEQPRNSPPDGAKRPWIEMSTYARDLGLSLAIRLGAAGGKE